MSGPHSTPLCGLCGKDPAEGFATVNGVRYCHEGSDPTCYMRAQWRLAVNVCRDPIGGVPCRACGLGGPCEYEEGVDPYEPRRDKDGNGYIDFAAIARDA